MLLFIYFLYVQLHCLFLLIFIIIIPNIYFKFYGLLFFQISVLDFRLSHVLR